MAAAVARARETGGAAVVLTFDPHPARVLRPDGGSLGAHDARAEGGAGAALGIDRLVALAFDARLAALTPEAFVQRGARLAARGASRGGRGVVPLRARAAGRRAHARGARRPAGLRRAGGEARCSTPGVPSAAAACARRSPRATCKDAAELLGRPYALDGRVVRGDGRGRGLGIPTANLAVEEQLLPGARGLRRPRAGAGRGLARGGRQRRRASDLRRDGPRGRGAPAGFRGRPLRRARAAVVPRAPARRRALRERARRSSSASTRTCARRASSWRRPPGYSRRVRRRDERALRFEP